MKLIDITCRIQEYIVDVQGMSNDSDFQIWNGTWKKFEQNKDT